MFKGKDLNYMQIIAAKNSALDIASNATTSIAKELEKVTNLEKLEEIIQRLWDLEIFLSQNKK